MLRLEKLVAYCFMTLQVASLSVATERPNTERPNILLAIADDASYPHMGAYGTEWTETPAFDRVAREGLLFTRCYTPNAKSRTVVRVYSDRTQFMAVGSGGQSLV